MARSAGDSLLDLPLPVRVAHKRRRGEGADENGYGDGSDHQKYNLLLAPFGRSLGLAARQGGGLRWTCGGKGF